MPTIQHRRGTKSQWATVNPVLASGELGFEVDTDRHKIGNGLSTWDVLPYFANENDVASSFARGGGDHVSISWDGMWAANQVALARAWYHAATGPRVPVDFDSPLIGVVGVSSHADAKRLRGKVIQGQLDITNSGYEVRDFYLVGVTELPEIIKIKPGVQSTIHHFEIDGRHLKTNNYGIGGATAASLTVSHGKIHGVSDGFRIMGGSSYEYMFVYDPLQWDGAYDSETDPHSDGMQIVNGTAEVRRSFVEIPPSAGSNIVAVLTANTSVGPIDLSVDSSYLLGGGYTINQLSDTNGVPELSITNCRFGTNHGSTRGLWNLADAAKVVRSNNVYADTDSPVPNTVGPLASRSYRPLTLDKEVVGGDTGWRKLVGWTGGVVDYGFQPTGLVPKPDSTGGVYLRRVGNMVYFGICQGQVGATQSSFAITVPSEFGNGGGSLRPIIPASGGSGASATVRVDYSQVTVAASSNTALPSSTTTGAMMTVSWPNSLSWPSTLPGMPA